MVFSDPVTTINRSVSPTSGQYSYPYSQSLLVPIVIVSTVIGQY